MSGKASSGSARKAAPAASGAGMKTMLAFFNRVPATPTSSSQSQAKSAVPVTPPPALTSTPPSASSATATPPVHSQAMQTPSSAAADDASLSARQARARASLSNTVAGVNNARASLGLGTGEPVAYKSGKDTMEYLLQQQNSASKESKEIDDDEVVDVSRKRKSDSGADQNRRKRQIRDDDDEDYAPEEEDMEEEDYTPSPAKRERAAPSSAAKVKKEVVELDDEFPMDDDENPNRPNASKAYDSSWYQPDKVRDANGKRPGDPGYNARTLFVPPQLYREMTPAEQQFWDLKRQNRDVVLLFKMGKFYEMFDMDAQIGVDILGLNYMVNQARPHAGFPEAAYAKYAEQLCRMGYKVGRVEQTETPKQLAEANAISKKSGQKQRKILRRDMICILTPGTLNDPELLGNSAANYCLAVCERPRPKKEAAPENEQETEEAETPASKRKAAGGGEPVTEYGVAFCDTATGKFWVGQFLDDKQRSQLRTLLGQVNPRELVRPALGLTPETDFVFRIDLPDLDPASDINTLSDNEFWSAADTFDQIEKRNYFPATNPDEPTSGWPRALAIMAEERRELAFSAFGGLLFYLQRTLTDSVVKLGAFKLYEPSNALEAETLIIDGQTLNNLEIIKNAEGKRDGTLLSFVDQCVSSFGHRQIQLWLTAPKMKINEINERLDSVEYFMRESELAERVRLILKRLPDLERLLSRVHAHGLKQEREAVMYGNVDEKKLKMFFKVLEGFRDACKIQQLFLGLQMPKKIEKLMTPGLSWPAAVDSTLQFFFTAFDWQQAEKQFFIVPTPGTSPDFDQAVEAVQEAEAALAEYLEQMRQRFSDRRIQWVHRNKEVYQLEIPVQSANRVPKEFELVSSSKTHKRYWNSEIRQLSANLDDANDRREELLKDSTREMFARFAQHHEIWAQTIQCIAELDCLIALARVSNVYESVRPEFVEPEDNNGEPLLEIRDAVHPVLAGLRSDRQFIPNDTVIGAAENAAKFVLVSGANMGGKSTLLRQTCCSVILAQMGCYVPAKKCRLTPVDRIFTRVGANDKIMQGQSTFLVELMETATILRHATNRSLVILDELGRGTSTFDGTAIAHAVIHYLSRDVGCLALFSTHYHMLIDQYKDDPAVSFYQMASEVQRDQVVFLYKFLPGTCPKSYGMNVAHLAGLSEEIIENAKRRSEEFEQKLEAALKHGGSRFNFVDAPQCSPAVHELVQLLRAPADERLQRWAEFASAVKKLRQASQAM